MIERMAMVLLLASVLGTTPAWAADTPGQSPSGGAQQQATPPTTSVRVEYRVPKDPKLEPIRAMLQEHHALELFAEYLGTLRLPKQLTLAADGCDGVANAWYEPTDATVTVCYELVAEFVRNAQDAPKDGVDTKDATNGPFAFVLLHESSHAVFDLLHVPILGREEDAADQVAAYVLLKTGREVARRTLVGTAWMYVQQEKVTKLNEKTFANEHSIAAQLYYQVLCLAYGSDPKYFHGAIDRGHLPKERAEGCTYEYHQVEYAVQTLIGVHADKEAIQRFRIEHQFR